MQCYISLVHCTDHLFQCSETLQQLNFLCLQPRTVEYTLEWVLLRNRLYMSYHFMLLRCSGIVWQLDRMKCEANNMIVSKSLWKSVPLISIISESVSEWKNRESKCSFKTLQWFSKLCFFARSRIIGPTIDLFNKMLLFFPTWREFSSNIRKLANNPFVFLSIWFCVQPM